MPGETGNDRDITQHVVEPAGWAHGAILCKSLLLRYNAPPESERAARKMKPPATPPPVLDARAAAVLREIVERYVETGEPVGSRTVSQLLPLGLSPATIRSVMSDLTEAGLLFSPHTSAGRLPTERGLRLFVDGLLQFGELGAEERDTISRALERKGRSLQDTMTEASTMLAGLSAAAGLVLAP
jgi:heat-inducible transcriptional repressor